MKPYLLLILLFFSIPIFASPHIELTPSQYVIHGANARELRMQMETFGPIENNKRYDANTTWHLQWDLSYLENAHDCTVDKVTVNLAIQTMLPNWSDSQNADTTLQNLWHTFLANLESHENNHAAHGKRAAAEVEAAILHLPAMENCELLVATANNDAEKITAEYKDKDVQYDTATLHGQKEGATL